MNRTRSLRRAKSVHSASITSTEGEQTKRGLFRRSASADIHVHPLSQQNNALSDNPGKALNLAKQIVAGNPQAHFDKAPARLKKRRSLAVTSGCFYTLHIQWG